MVEKVVIINKEKKEMATKRYHYNFLSKNKEKIQKSNFCEICGGIYTYFNKSRHNKSNKHQFCLKKLKNEDDNVPKEIRNISITIDDQIENAIKILNYFSQKK